MFQVSCVRSLLLVKFIFSRYIKRYELPRFEHQHSLTASAGVCEKFAGRVARMSILQTLDRGSDCPPIHSEHILNILSPVTVQKGYEKRIHLSRGT